jgi:hypothetical protein
MAAVEGCSHASIVASRCGLNHGRERNQVRQQVVLPFSVLQRVHAGTRFERNVLPPLDLGLTWSRVRLPLSPQ